METLRLFIYDDMLIFLRLLKFGTMIFESLANLSTEIMMVFDQQIGDSICKIYPNSYIWALMKIDNIGDSIFQSTKYNLFCFEIYELRKAD